MTLPTVYCPRCGTQNADDAATCSSCGNDLQTWRGANDRDAAAQQAPIYAQQPAQPPHPPQPYGPPQHIPNYMGQAIALTVVGVVCCWVLPAAAGVPAIVYASQVNTKLQMGDVAGAMNSSRLARIWCWVSLGILLASGLLLLSIFAIPAIGEF